MSERLIPLGSNVVVKPIEPGDKTHAGLVLISHSDTEIHYAKVVAFGKGYFKKEGGYHPLQYKVGDIIFYGKGERREYFLNGSNHVLLKDDDIMGIFTGDRKFLKLKNQKR